MLSAWSSVFRSFSHCTLFLPLCSWTPGNPARRASEKKVFEVEPLPAESPLWDLPNVTEEIRDVRVRSAAEWVDRGSLGTTALEAKWPRGICARNFGKRQQSVKKCLPTLACSISLSSVPVDEVVVTCHDSWLTESASLGGGILHSTRGRVHILLGHCCQRERCFRALEVV